MKNRKIKRFFALVLVFALTATAIVGASADNYTGDINGDGKITAFDAQLLAEANADVRELNDKQKEAAKKSTVSEIIDFILGKETENVGKVYIDGYNVIQNAEDLRALANASSNEKYILMADIDLQGAEWTPIKFSGEFYGNGHTISNLTINKSLGAMQGFFGLTTAEAVVKDLALRNVTLNAASSPTSIGLAVGVSNGTLENVTVTGAIKDNRTAASGNTEIHIGAVVGKTTASAGTHTVGNSITVTDGAGKYSVSGLCADVKLHIKKDSAKVVHNGLYGSLYEGTSITGQWHDSTYSSSLLSETIQARQEKVVDYMNAMASVEWTPAEDWTYISTNGTDQTYKAGTTYTGLPYNSNNGSLERFMSVMQAEKVTNKDGKTVYISQPGLGSNCGWDAATGKWSDTGFYLTMGNHCSAAVGWAWDQVSNTVAEENLDHQTPYKGGAWVVSTDLMIPNNTNRAAKGIYPVGDWEASHINENNKWVGAYDATKAAYQCGDETYAAEVLLREDNGMNTIWEAYAQTHKADAVVTFVSKWGTSAGGHARLVAADPVVIRNADGSIDAKASYMLLTEQGVNFSTGSTCHWNIEKKYTFYELTGGVAESAITDETKVYLPITIRALKEDKIRENYLISDPKNPVIGPAAGTVYSYHHINSVTVKVTDDAGKVYYEHEAFTGIGSNASGRNNSQDLADLHGKTFAAAAIENGMISGNTYYYTVDVLLSTGETMRLNIDPKFTYTA